MEGQIPRRCASSITEILHRRFRFDTSRRTGNAGIVCLRGSFNHPFAIRQYMADQLDCRPWPWDTPSSVSYSLKKNGKVSTTCKCNFTYTPLEVAAQTTVQLWFTILVCAIVKLSRLFVDPMVYCRYGFGFGSPVSRALGIGYVQELVARLTHTPIKTYNSSTNSTLDGNPITFPLDQSLYVDATHDGLVLSGNCCSSFSWYVIYLFKLVIAALNLNTFAESGPLSYTHIRHDRSFRVSELAPFATNIQFQRVYSFLPSTNFLISLSSVLECTSLPDPQIRVIINDGVVPLTGIRGCGKHNHGMCPVDKFVAAQKETIQTTDWEYDCHGDWAASLEPEWQTVTGDPPKRK